MYVLYSVRVMRLEKEMFQSLGLEVTGGNLVGIYVKDLTEDSLCKVAGLELGDRLIKVLIVKLLFFLSFLFFLFFLSFFFFFFLSFSINNFTFMLQAKISIVKNNNDSYNKYIQFTILHYIVSELKKIFCKGPCCFDSCKMKIVKTWLPIMTK